MTLTEFLEAQKKLGLNWKISQKPVLQKKVFHYAPQPKKKTWHFEPKQGIFMRSFGRVR